MNKFYHPKFEVSKVSTENHIIEFTAQPLVQGFGTTLGNSLRRVLLSSLRGTAIFGFRIKGVVQEFQNLSGVTENVLQIGLNIQKVLLLLRPDVFAEEEILRLHLKVKGERIVRASDIEIPAGLEIINPETILFNIVDNNCEIEIEFWAMQGRGFANFEETKDLIRRLDQDKFGIIALSANFSPVEKVAVKVEEIKVGERAVIEKLKLKIQSNGTLDPVRCLVNAAKIFTAHLNFFIELEKKNIQDFVFQEKKPLEKIEFDTEVVHLDFSKRTDNALQIAGIKKLSQLRKLSRKQLSDMKNIGQKSLDEIETKLKNEYNIILED